MMFNLSFMEHKMKVHMRVIIMRGVDVAMAWKSPLMRRYMRLVCDSGFPDFRGPGRHETAPPAPIVYIVTFIPQLPDILSCLSCQHWTH